MSGELASNRQTFLFIAATACQHCTVSAWPRKKARETSLDFCIQILFPGDFTQGLKLCHRQLSLLDFFPSRKQKKYSLQIGLTVSDAGLRALLYWFKCKSIQPSNASLQARGRMRVPSVPAPRLGCGMKSSRNNINSGSFPQN